MLRLTIFSKTVEWVVKKCKALLFDAIQERLGEFFNGRQVNEHRFKKGNCLRVDGVHGYLTRVTRKMYISFVMRTYSGCSLTFRGWRTH